MVSLQANTGLTWNILCRIALSLSLRDPSMPDPVEDKFGIDINRYTITGENDYVYKALIRQHAQKNISDEEYLPALFNAHLERGVGLLENEYNHVKNYDKILLNLLREI